MRLLSWPGYVRDLLELRRQAKRSSERFPFGKLYPVLGEGSQQSGRASGHYFHQDLLIARRVFLANPEKHVDIGSRIDGFVAHVASFREIEVLDVRPLESSIPNVVFTRADLMSDDFGLVDYCDSVSSLHALEHFGLGRYGDEVDFEGHLKGLANIRRMLRAGGAFYLSVPIGPQRIEFNAHRVFSVRHLLDLLDGVFRVDRFSYVNDARDLVRDAPLTASNVASNFSCRYGCGIFELTKT